MVGFSPRDPPTDEISCNIKQVYIVLWKLEQLFTYFQTRPWGCKRLTNHNTYKSITETKSLTSIIAALMKTDENMINLQLLFCKFQQKSKTGEKQ